MNINFKEMTLNELKAARICIDQEIAARHAAETGSFTVHFLESNRTNGTAVKPYAARVPGLSEKFGFQREFIDLERTYGHKEIIVEGEFEVEEGEVIEMQIGGTSKNPHRDWHIGVAGELKKIGMTSDADNKRNLKRYFQGKIGIAELIGEPTECKD